MTHNARDPRFAQRTRGGQRDWDAEQYPAEGTYQGAYADDADDEEYDWFEPDDDRGFFERNSAGIGLLLAGMLGLVVVALGAYFLLPRSGQPVSLASPSPQDAVSGVQHASPSAAAANPSQPPSSPEQTSTAQTPPAGATPSPLGEATPTAPDEPTPQPLVLPAGWTGPEPVSTRFYGSFDMVVDGSGVAHAAAELDGGIFHLTNETGRWTRERLSEPPGARGHDDEPVIALDVDGGLAVGFIRYRRWRCELDCYGTPDGMYVTSRRSGRWVEPTKVPLDHAYAGSVDSHEGQTHVVVERSDSDESSSVWYGKFDGGDWSLQPLAAPASNADLAVAADGTASIVFQTDRLTYVTVGLDGQPVVQQLSVESSYSEPLLMLDRGDGPHIVYTTWDDDGRALHTRREAGSWSEPEVVFPGVHIADPCGDTVYEAVAARAAAVDTRGFVHALSPTEFFWLGLWYSNNRSGEFVPLQLATARDEYCLEDVAIDGDPNGPVALAVDSQGRPHMLFYSGDEQHGLVYVIGPAD